MYYGVGVNGFVDLWDFFIFKVWFEEKNWGIGGFIVIYKFGGVFFDVK